MRVRHKRRYRYKYRVWVRVRVRELLQVGCLRARLGVLLAKLLLRLQRIGQVGPAKAAVRRLVALGLLAQLLLVQLKQHGGGRAASREGG